MDSVRKFQLGLFSEEARRHRQARRRTRYAQIQDLSGALTENSAEFRDRFAYVWGSAQERGASRKLTGNAGMAAGIYVTEVLGEYDLGGTVRTRYAGMQREAGRG